MPPEPSRPYQNAGADFLATRKRALLGDDPGLGKTRQTIQAWEAENCRRIMVICPAVSRLVWPAELDKWQTHPNVPVTVIAPGTTAWNENQIQALVDLPAIIVIVAFDTFSTVRMNPTSRAIARAMARASWDLVVIDEGHRLANPGSMRTQMIYGRRLDRVGCMVQNANRVWVLTGTPTPNNASEIYPHAKALWPEALAPDVGEHYQFIERFCTYRDTPYGRAITGSKNHAELRRRLGPHILRRRKHEVLPELPPMNFVVTPVPSEVLAALGTDIAVPADLEGDELLAYVQAHSAALSTLRRRMGTMKVPATCDYVEDLLSSGVPKVVVFAHHTEVIDQLRRNLIEHGAVQITGATGTSERGKAIVAFQNDANTRVLVGQIDACGVSITLTASSDVVFAECSWVPGANVQAASRCHRLGQKGAVLARMLTVPGSLDERIITALMRKAQDIAALWDNTKAA